ncbi:MAG TPA: ATP-binding protein [Rhizomicrobium sp.]|nr:ATP-binding protein [Rhizomicrobium sp.]
MILRSVTSRLVFFYCALLVLLGGAFLLFTVFSFRIYIRQSVVSSLAVRTQEIWNLSEGVLHDRARLAELIERRFAPEAQDRFIRIRADGGVVYQSGEPAGHIFSVGDVPLQYVGDASRDVTIGDLLLYTRKFREASGHSVTVESGQSYSFARTLQNRLATSLLIGLPVMLLLAAVAGYILMRRALTPVEGMINAAETYTFNNPHNRLPLAGTEPRIEALGLALNRMLDRLDNAYSHVSRFSADAAHELRTPITIIRGELELVVAQAKPSSDVDRAIGNALEEMTRLSGMVDSLITLSRMESMWGKMTHSSVDLLALAAETIDQMNLLAEEKHITLEKPSGSSVLVAGDRDRLKQVLVNLLDNAIKYTPVGGQVTVHVGAAGDLGFFEVEDSGIGIDPLNHERVFDRFYRVSADRGETGAGLGLAIVKSICQAHGGTVFVRSASEIGSIFRVELPLATSVLPESVEGRRRELAAANEAAAVPDD